MKRLPDAELEVMKALWAEKGKNIPRSVLGEKLAAHGWAANTINTYLLRLTEKGFVSSVKEGRHNLYTPLVSKADYLAFDSKSTLSKLYGSSPRNFLAALARNDGLDRGQIEALRSLLDELSGGTDDG